MNDLHESPPSTRRLTATDMRKLPHQERRRLLAEQAVLAKVIYRDNPELSDLEAFGPEDLYADVASDESV